MLNLAVGASLPSFLSCVTGCLLPGVRQGLAGLVALRPGICACWTSLLQRAAAQQQHGCSACLEVDPAWLPNPAGKPCASGAFWVEEARAERTLRVILILLPRTEMCTMPYRSLATVEGQTNDEIVAKAECCCCGCFVRSCQLQSKSRTADECKEFNRARCGGQVVFGQ